MHAYVLFQQYFERTLMIVCQTFISVTS